MRHTLHKPQLGITLIELILVIAIMAVLAAIAIPKFQDYRDGINVQKAISDIAEISAFIKQYETENRFLPDSLSEVGAGTRLDPWGNPYMYFNIGTAKGKGKLRKDKSLNPINSDYDLYSMGKDGQSSTALTAKNSHDDVIRARDGQYIGLASDF
jgi:general secretion pathway protein G